MTSSLTIRLPTALNRDLKHVLLDLEESGLRHLSLQRVTVALYEELLSSSDLQRAITCRVSDD